MTLEEAIQECDELLKKYGILKGDLT